MNGRVRAGICAGIGLLLLVLLPALLRAGEPAHATPQPRDLSPAERAAVELAAAYLQRGPEAWWERLATRSPLRRLNKAVALDQIAVRAGPPDGAAWQLLTPGRPDPERAVFNLDLASGIDDVLTLRLVDEGGWKIADVRTTIDPVDLAPGIPAGAAPAVSDPAADPAADPPPAPPEAPRSPYLPLFGLGVAVLALLGGAAGSLLLARSGRTFAAVCAGTVALGVIGGGLFWGWSAGEDPAALRAGPARAAGRTDLGVLAPLRAALAAGDDRAEIERLLAAAPSDPKLRQAQDLWRAQYLLNEGDLRGAETILKTLPESAAVPLAELLRARLAFRRMQSQETGWRYEQAIARGLDNDGVRMEAAFAKALTDEADRAETDLALIVQTGSRLAEPWYVAAQVAISQDRKDEAESLLRRAWQLEPVPRAELFDNPLLAHLVVQPSLFPLFALATPEEARLAPTGPNAPLALPAGAQAATCGQSLRLTLPTAGGTAELLVPAGAELAPPGTVLENADTWSRHTEAKALAALPVLEKEAGNAAAAGLPPRLLRLAEQAGTALAEQNRWADLLALTAPLAAHVETAPVNLVRLRARALHHLDRDEDARQLLVRLAKSDIAGRRPATATLFELSELFAAAGDYDTAIKLIEKADAQLPEPRGTKRRRQLQMDRDLAASYASFRSEHFEVRYPTATGERYARQIAWVLEEERTRLLHWIPPSRSTSRIEVHLFPVKDFVANFGGDIAVVGLFDGKVRVPFAEVRSLHPQLIAILSHELAHALMAAATHGQTPHWMQEGLAQHIEMGTQRVNPLPDLVRTGHALSFPTVDPILRGFAEEQLVDLAYNEAAWSIAFLESRFGEAAVPRLLNAFAVGKTTEQALREVCGMTPAEFDRAFWAWGTGPGPRVRALAVRRYDVDDAVREAQKEAESVPRISSLRSGREEQKKTETQDLSRRMTDWHAAYAEQTAGLKRTLKPILQAYGGETNPERGSTAAACRDLSAAAAQTLADGRTLQSPDPAVNRSLREAFTLISNLGDACRTAQDAQVHALIDKVSQALGRAAQRLAPYGLTP